MRLTLIHNETAGSGEWRRGDIVAPLRRAGFDVAYRTLESDDPAGALDDPGDLVVVAGGDGAVAEVARRLVGTSTPLFILPLGTANNIAFSHGVRGTPDELLDLLRPDRVARLPRRSWGVAHARAPWGERRFVESVGLGLIARLIRQSGQTTQAEGQGGDAGKSAASGTDTIDRGRQRLLGLLDEVEARRYELEADGEELGGDYIMVQVLNIDSIGPRLELAPGAGRDDGLLTLVLLAEADRSAFAAYLRSLLEGCDVPSPVPAHRVRRVRRLRLAWPFDDGHLDDELWPDSSVRRSRSGDTPTVELTTVEGRLEVLVPGP